ncbi:MAG: thioredoxin domain-containing protein [bacterium]|nr:thioredoxin domain-containing protein [bacterium]
MEPQEKQPEEKKEEQKEEKKEEYVEIKFKKEYILAAVAVAVAAIVLFLTFWHLPAHKNSKQQSSSQQLSLNLHLPFKYNTPTFIVVVSPAQHINMSLFKHISQAMSNTSGLHFRLVKVYTTSLSKQVLRALRIIPAIILYIPPAFMQNISWRFAQFLNYTVKLAPHTYLVLPYNGLIGYGFLANYYRLHNVSFYYTLHPKVIIVNGELSLARVNASIRRIARLLSFVLAANITPENIRIISYKDFKYKNASFIYPVILVEANVPEFYPGAKKIGPGLFLLTPLNFQNFLMALGVNFFEVHKEPKIYKGDLVLGNPEKSPVVIFEFMDLHCPFCARYQEETFPKIYKNYIKTGKVAYVYKSFIVHPSSYELHRYWICSYMTSHNPSLGFEIVETLYKDFWNNIMHNKFVVPSLKDLEKVVEGKVDWLAVERCANSSKYVGQLIENDSAQAEKYGITGTPGFVVWSNKLHVGLAFAGAYPYEIFKDILNTLLAAS